MMTKVNRLSAQVGMSCVLAFMTGQAVAADASAAFIGKQEWLFYKYEFSEPSHDELVKKSQELIANFERALAARGIRLTVAMVPLKIRVYSEFLPDEIKLSPYVQGNYSQMLGAFASAGVNTADLNSAFLNSPERGGDTPLYFRLDSHWTPVGARVGAEALKKSLESDSKSNELLATVPTVKYTYKVANRKRPSRGRDLVDQLPPNSPTFAPELVAQVNVLREKANQADLLGAQETPKIGLVGSSYSRDWTGFSDAIRYVLQRDVAVAAVGADQGSWVGMESYLKDEAFQANPPKLLIWEMPERDMRAPPDYKYREARYVMSNAEWLKRVTELVQKAPVPR